MIGLILILQHKLNKQAEQFSMLDWDKVAGCLPGRKAEDCKFKLFSLMKIKIKQNKWLQDQNQILNRIIDNPETTDWTEVSKLLYKINPNPNKVYRSGKQCREHYFCYLDPQLRKGPWTEHQDKTLIELYKIYGRKWYQMSKSLVGRNQNSIKNRFSILCKTQKIVNSFDNLQSSSEMASSAIAGNDYVLQKNNSIIKNQQVQAPPPKVIKNKFKNQLFKLSSIQQALQERQKQRVVQEQQHLNFKQSQIQSSNCQMMQGKQSFSFMQYMKMMSNNHISEWNSYIANSGIFLLQSGDQSSNNFNL